MIQSINISKRFENNIGVIEVLKKITFSVEKGSFTSLIGPSGCGKTTLLRIIGSIAEPSEGEVLVDGDPSGYVRSNHRFGFVFQEPALLPWRTVLRNIQLPGEILRETKIIARAHELINLVGLEGFENAFPKQLSGGMKTRVALARALIFHPQILLMDEPFGSLDEITRDTMNFELLRIWKEIKTTIIFVTHSISEAVLLSDKVIVLTPRPAEIKKIVTVNLSRPRSREMRREPNFVKMVEDIREQLNQ